MSEPLIYLIHLINLTREMRNKVVKKYFKEEGLIIGLLDFPSMK